MKLRANLTEPERDAYRKLCAFTEQEQEVFDLRTVGKSIIEISMKLHLSTATINRRIRAIKDKMSRVDIRTQI